MYRTFGTSFKAVLMAAMSASLFLGGCATSDPGADQRMSQVDSALDRALERAAESGGDKSLVFLERIYKRNPGEEQAALRYAKALRDNEYYNRASIVLRGLARNPEDASAAVLTEYSAVSLALGDYQGAERYAQQAVLKDETNAKAYHNLGIALDALGMHEQAERAFRKGLDYWQGDPTPIINNLALNLASQEHLGEALTLLEKAMAVSPGRTELERNHRIIKAIQRTKSFRVPPPPRKPEGA